jgi:hypothetical protein
MDCILSESDNKIVKALQVLLIEDEFNSA